MVKMAGNMCTKVTGEKCVQGGSLENIIVGSMCRTIVVCTVYISALH